MRAIVILAIIITCVTGVWIKLQRQDLVNKLPSSGYFDDRWTVNAVDCARQCAEHTGCKSYFYVAGTAECQLHWYLYNSSSAGLTDASSTAYWERDGLAACVPTPFSCPSTSATGYNLILLPHCNESFSYRIFDDGSRDFWESKSKCEAEGANLVEVLTPSKMAYMLQLVTCTEHLPLDFWISGLYNDATATYETTSGKPLPMSEGDFWDFGRPNADMPNGTCVRIMEGHGYLFDDYFCTGNMPRTICEL